MNWWDHNLGKNFTIQDFRSWTGDHTIVSRQVNRNYVITQNYKSVLDCGAGMCTDFDGYKLRNMPVNYVALDGCEQFMQMAKFRRINAVIGSIEQIPFGNNFFDVVQCRHVLEHLSYYENAVKEMLRVAKHMVWITFFIVPWGEPDHFGSEDGIPFNRYNKTKLTRLIRRYYPSAQITKFTHGSDHSWRITKNEPNDRRRNSEIQR